MTQAERNDLQKASVEDHLSVEYWRTESRVRSMVPWENVAFARSVNATRATTKAKRAEREKRASIVERASVRNGWVNE